MKRRDAYVSTQLREDNLILNDIPVLPEHVKTFIETKLQPFFSECTLKERNFGTTFGRRSVGEPGLAIGTEASCIPANVANGPEGYCARE